MKKLTKKQMIATGVIVVLVLGGITGGVVNHNYTVHAQQVAKTKAHEAKVKADKKAEAKKEAQEKEAAQEKQVATLLATATKHPSAASIKAVDAAINKLTDQKAKAKDNDLVKALNARLTLIKKAQSAVKDYQAHATDANKQKVAQAAINALKDKNDQKLKAQLQKLYNASNQQAQAAAQAQAKQAAAAAKVTQQAAQKSSSQNQVAQPAQQAATSQSQATNQPATSTNSTPVTQAPTGSNSTSTAGNTNSTANTSNQTSSSATQSGTSSAGTSSASANAGSSSSQNLPNQGADYYSNNNSQQVQNQMNQTEKNGASQTQAPNWAGGLYNK